MSRLHVKRDYRGYFTHYFIRTVFGGVKVVSVVPGLTPYVYYNGNK